MNASDIEKAIPVATDEDDPALVNAALDYLAQVAEENNAESAIAAIDAERVDEPAEPSQPDVEEPPVPVTSELDASPDQARRMNKQAQEDL